MAASAETEAMWIGRTLSLWLALWGTGAQAFYMSGADLMDRIRADERATESSALVGIDILHSGQLYGFVAATFDTATVTATICPAQQRDLSEVVDVVSRWMKANPQETSQPAATLVMRALRAAYPCRQQGR